MDVRKYMCPTSDITNLYTPYFSLVVPFLRLIETPKDIYGRTV